jgi:hypothetical protein
MAGTFLVLSLQGTPTDTLTVTAIDETLAIIKMTFNLNLILILNWRGYDLNTPLLCRASSDNFVIR